MTKVHVQQSPRFNTFSFVGVCGNEFFIRAFTRRGQVFFVLRDITEILGVHKASNVARRRVMAGHLYRLEIGSDEMLVTTLAGVEQAVHSQVAVVQLQATRKPFSCEGQSAETLKTYTSTMQGLLRKMRRAAAQVTAQSPGLLAEHTMPSRSVLGKRADTGKADLPQPQPQPQPQAVATPVCAVDPTGTGFVGLALPVSSQARQAWETLSADDKATIQQTLETVTLHLGHVQATRQQTWVSDKIRRVVMQRRMRSFLELFDLLDPEADLAPQGV